MADTPNGNGGGRNWQAEYTAAGHAIQSGVAMEMAIKDNLDPDKGIGRYAKHLRTGLNLRACDHAALVSLLVAKGVITSEEYGEALVKEAWAEVKRYEDALTEMMRKQPGASPDLTISLH